MKALPCCLLLSSVLLAHFPLTAQVQPLQMRAGIGSSPGTDSTERSELEFIIDDRDGQLYRIVQLGSQVWMGENLNTVTFLNGDTIPQAISNEDWVKAGQNALPVWCHYNNDTSMASKFGKLYNWYAVSDPRGLAPNGWHVASDSEFETLAQFLGGIDAAGGSMKGGSEWMESVASSDDDGFNGLPGGNRHFTGTFEFIGQITNWWTSSAAASYNAWHHYLRYNSEKLHRYYSHKALGFYVRCIKD